MDSPGLREQNKQKTRRAIEEAAARLFGERGFEHTTVRDIATAAGVGERTFFRYFPSKESLIVGQVRDLIPRLARLLRERPAAEAPYRAMCNAVLTLAGEHDVPPAIFITGSPKDLTPDSSRTDRFLLRDLEQAVTAAMEERLGAGEDAPDLRLRAAVKARAGVSALRGLLAVHTGSTLTTSLGMKQLAGLVEDAFAALDD
ncbi:TetR family transcriptional regulator [Streptomyces sp. SID3212]|uniref:TetR family transcriptional regulator n=1 Tax=Streptomyces sp. SID3212 TaxID=2690259 RepID=UPI00136D5EB6|nr:TetR family transcriptional regulator [Streptomyces sp. SID3212]MYV51729.1 TetR family transcriptional regulator [Streptomyces sp. SID3212]